jgi:hypothetical protein
MQLHADESYTLKIPDSGGAASLAANTTWGALRGLETLSQLVEWREEPGRYELRMAPWEIEDSPRFPYRGAFIVSYIESEIAAHNSRQSGVHLSFVFEVHWWRSLTLLRTRRTLRGTSCPCPLCSARSMRWRTTR